MTATSGELYFGYGSNLDADNWGAWCHNKGYDPASLEPIGRAWLPDYEPVFHYQSRLRKGGALDVRPRFGTATPGALFRVHDWAGLDAKEGVKGSFYRPIAVTALTADGRAHAATTYTVCDHRLHDFVPPGADYRRYVVRGLCRFGHPTDQFLDVADGKTPAPLLQSFFAYGTLMTGQRSHHLVERHLDGDRRPAKVTGASLVRIDWYPGLVLTSEGTVHGELLDLRDTPRVLGELDPYEDFAGYGVQDSLYRRSLVSALTSEGSKLAWTYVFTGRTDAHPSIASGRWTAP
ncbi:MAG: gamma-glutamylcyclotransferase [Myxococcota bacterium]